MSIRTFPLTLLLLSSCLILPACQSNSSNKTESKADGTTSTTTLRWGGSEIGGAPHTFKDPENPGKIIGFEKDIADEIGRRMDRKMEFVKTPFDSIIPALNRRNFDFGLSGIEITDQRSAHVNFTQPYYKYTKQLVVRANTPNIKSLGDLKGHAVGTLLASTSEDILEKLPEIEVRSYEDPQRPYDDLLNGKVDGVLLDLPIAIYYAGSNPKLRLTGESIEPAFYGIAVRKDNQKLLDQLNNALTAMKNDGTLQRILEHWKLWNDMQTVARASSP